MKNLNYLNEFRKPYIGGLMGDEKNGFFDIKIGNQTFGVIASNGSGWEHVSVCPKTAERCPKWNEMSKIKELFFEDDEVVMQLHPAKKEYININDYCLHLWRPIGSTSIPLPPKYMV